MCTVVSVEKNFRVDWKLLLLLIVIFSLVILVSQTVYASKLIKLESEMTAAMMTSANVVLIGGPCSNTMVEELAVAGKFDYTCASWPADKFGMIKLITDYYTTGRVTLVVAGSTTQDVKLACEVLQNHENSKIRDGLMGDTVKITGSSVETATIKSLDGSPSGKDLSDYPEFLFTDGRLDAYFVVGKNAEPEHTVAATDLMTSLLPCGNGYCDSTEDCSSCPSDCGACAMTTPIPSGSGGGGGGSVPLPSEPTPVEEEVIPESIVISEKKVVPGGGGVTPRILTEQVPQASRVALPVGLIIFIIFFVLAIVGMSIISRKKPIVGKKMKICPNCQRVFEERLNFCTQCGTKLSEYVEAKRGIPIGKIILVLVVLVLSVLFILYFMTSRITAVQRPSQVTEIGMEEGMTIFCDPCFKYFTLVEWSGDVIVLRNEYPDKITIVDVASDVLALEFTKTSLASGDVVKIGGLPQKKDVGIRIKYEIMSTGVLNVDTGVMHQKS